MWEIYAKIKTMAVKRTSSFRKSLAESVWPVKKRRWSDANTSWSRVLNDFSRDSRERPLQRYSIAFFVLDEAAVVKARRTEVVPRLSRPLSRWG